MSTAKDLNPEEISALVCVSQSTIRRYLTLFERTGDVQHRRRKQYRSGGAEEIFCLINSLGCVFRAFSIVLRRGNEAGLLLKWGCYSTLSHIGSDAYVQPISQRHGPAKLLRDFEQLVLLELVSENPGIFLDELKDKLSGRFGVTVHTSTICRALQFIGCTRQVIKHIPLQCSDEMRAKFMVEVSIYDPSMLIWIDESGCDRRHSMRTWGYGLRGIQPKDHRILARGKRYSAIPVMSLEGIR